MHNNSALMQIHQGIRDLQGIVGFEGGQIFRIIVINFGFFPGPAFGFGSAIFGGAFFGPIVAGSTPIEHALFEGLTDAIRDQKDTFGR